MMDNISRSKFKAVLHIELLKGVWHGIDWENSGELFSPKAHFKYLVALVCELALKNREVLGQLSRLVGTERVDIAK